MKKARTFFAILLAVLMTLSTGFVSASAEGQDVSPDFIYGDVTQNGKINCIDTAYLFLANIGIIRLNDAQKLAADVNADCKTDRADRKLIGKFVRKAIPTFPVEEMLWPEGTPIETTYDENGNPQIRFFSEFHNTPTDALKAVISGSGILRTEESAIMGDFDLGFLQKNVYIDINPTAVEQESVNDRLVDLLFKAKVFHCKFLQKDGALYAVLPGTRTYLEIPDEDDIPEEQLGAMESYLDQLDSYKSWINNYLIGTMLSGKVAHFFDGASIVKVGKIGGAHV